MLHAPDTATLDSVARSASSLQCRYMRQLAYWPVWSYTTFRARDGHTRAGLAHRRQARPRVQPDVLLLLQVVCWTLAEFGTSCGQSAESLMERLALVPDTQSVRSRLLQACLRRLRLLSRSWLGCCRAS